MKRTIIPIILVFPLMVLSVFLDAMKTQASPQDTTFIVNSTVDATDINPGDGICETAAGNGVCTLRAAVQETNAISDHNLIVLPSGIYTFTLPDYGEDASATGDLDITESVDIVGDGSTTTIIDGNNLDRVIDIWGTSASFTSITIRNGSVDGFGGGIRTNGLDSKLIISNSVVIHNNAQNNEGGGILASGKLTITHSSITDNTADDTGGGISFRWGEITPIDDPWLVIDHSIISENDAHGYAGLLVHCASALISNSTINNNRAENNIAGGGIGQVCSQGKMRIINSTISNNFAGGGAGISYGGQHLEVVNSTISENTSAGTGSAILGSAISLKNVTIAHNVSGSGGALHGELTLTHTILAFNGPQNCGTGTFTTQGYNLSSDSTCTLFLQTDQQNSDPLLNALADNGGPTLTHNLQEESPAIDAGNPISPGSNDLACPSTDQRNNPRPLDGNGTGAAICDIGAYEAPNATPTISIGNTAVTESNTGTTPAIFSVTLAFTPTLPITVSYESAPDTAVSHIDFLPISGTLSFAPGELTKTLAVSAIGDNLDEDDETFFINLSDPVNAAIGDGQGIGAILDDDDPPELSISDAEITEGDTDIVSTTFTVTLSTASGKMISVTYETADSTAMSNQDYTPISDTLTFAPGEISKTLTVHVHGDTIVEIDESFLMMLNNPMNVLITDPQGIGTIINDDYALYLPMIIKP